jgi:high-affinity iron transporter
MVDAFVIFLREGIEASMIVAILLAYLDRAGQRRYFRDVFAGVAAALVLAAAGGVAAYLTIRTYAGSRVQTIFETVTYVVAAAILTYMTFWMRRHSRTMSSELRARADAALGRGARAGLSLLAFQAVGREGLETVVFTLAIAFATSAGHVLIGGAAGLVVAALIACLIYRLGKQLNLTAFFTTVGALLMVFAAGLLADAVENLQELGWLPFLGQPLWNTGRVLSEDSTLGDIVHSFFGYASQPTVLQAVVYVTYLVVVLVAFMGWLPRRRPPREVTGAREPSRARVIAPSAEPR